LIMRGVIVILLLLAAVVPAGAADADVETQLREGLRNTMLQLREAQTKTAEMEASMVQSQLET